MKPKLTKLTGKSADWRSLAAVFAFLILVFGGLSTATAQLRPRRITSVWTTTTAEGSRVTVDGDAPVNDYEAYKRGDRFYVRIPLADLPSARGSLLGRGFDDVQIQRYGDGIMLSFRLQPGTTARVDQKGNRLDVIFATPGRSPAAAMAAASSGESTNRTRPRRTDDASGPTPPSSPAPTVKNRGSNHGNSTRASGSGQPTTARPTHNAPRDNASNSEPTRGNKRNDGTSRPPKAASPNSNGASPAGHTSPPPIVAAPSPSPARASASPTPSPVSAAPIASASVTPAASPYTVPSPSLTPGQQTTTAPAQTPTGAEPSSQTTDWASWKHYVKIWIILNWLPLLVGSLIVLCLLVLLLSWRRAQKQKKGTRKQVKEPAARSAAPATSVADSSVTAGSSSAASAVVADPPPARAETGNPSNPSRASEHKDGGDHDREVFEL